MNTTTFKLTDAHVHDFFEKGWFSLPGLFTPEEVSAIDAAVERLHDRADSLRGQLNGNSSLTHDGTWYVYDAAGRHVRFVAMSGNAESLLLDVARDSRLLGPAAQLLGSQQMQLLINQVHYKRPGSGVVFDWHQDSANRGIDEGLFVDINGKGSYVQTLLALDDTTPEAGPLQFVDGSSKLGHISGKLDAHLDPARISAPLPKRGDVLFFGPYTIHGSTANRSQQSRRVLINGYAYPGANRRVFKNPHQGETLTAPQA